MTPEEVYLGQVLQRNEVFFTHPLRPGDFVNARSRALFERISEVIDQGQRADIVSIATLGGFDSPWLSSLTNETTGSIDLLTERIIEDAKRHHLAMVCKETAERLSRERLPEVLEHLEAKLVEITERRDDTARHIRTDLKPMVEEFERRFKSHGEIPGVGSGLDDLDDLTLGWERSRLYVVGARPSEGKSALLLNFALAAKVPVGFISIESSRTEVVERAFSSQGGIDTKALRTGRLGHSDFKGLIDAADALDKSGIIIADKPNMQISEVKATARRMVRQHGVRVLLVDYLQLIQVPGSSNDYERVSHVSTALKALARELDIPVICAAQLNRGSEEGRNRKPRLSDFKNSGQIEQDADTAILIYRRVDKKNGVDETWLCIEKNRDGATGDIQVWFDRAKMRFRGHTHDTMEQSA